MINYVLSRRGSMPTLRPATVLAEGALKAAKAWQLRGELGLAPLGAGVATALAVAG